VTGDLADLRRRQAGAGDAGLVVCPWFSAGGAVVRTLAMVARSDHIAGVILGELHVELMYPLDDDDEHFFRCNADRPVR